MSLLGLGIAAAERGLVPDFVLRRAIRNLCAERLRMPKELEPGFAAELASGPVALVPEAANAQHYEVPAELFGLMLGPRRKYSCCCFAPGATLAQAEDAALAETCQRAGLADGQEILELGCGWGSLSLWMAERYPNARILGVSNSASQRAYIEAEARRRGFGNLRIVTADMNGFDPGRRFDRVVSVEMFEHMRNWRELFRRVAGWLDPDGKLFMHVFCHRDRCYPFETAGAGNWMGRHFFSGGLMPSADLPGRFADDLRVVKQWEWSGDHYRRTAESWLANLDARKTEALRLLGPDAARQFQRWRIFHLACAELFGYAGGSEWFVTHCLLEAAKEA